MKSNVDYSTHVEDATPESHPAMGAEPHADAEAPARASQPVGLPRFLRYYLGLGALGFGGPIAAVSHVFTGPAGSPFVVPLATPTPASWPTPLVGAPTSPGPPSATSRSLPRRVGWRGLPFVSMWRPWARRNHADDLKLLGRRLPAGPAVRVERVADDESSLQPLLVRLAAVADPVEDGEHAGRHRWRRLLLGEIGSADDASHPRQGLVADLVLVQQRLQGATATVVAELGPAHVEGDAGQPRDIPGPGHELEGGLGVDEPPDRPGGCDAVHVDPLTGDEVHRLRLLDRVRRRWP